MVGLLRVRQCAIGHVLPGSALEARRLAGDAGTQLYTLAGGVNFDRCVDGCVKSRGEEASWGEGLGCTLLK